MNNRSVPVRRGLFRSFWQHGRDLSAEAGIGTALRDATVIAPADDQHDPQEQALITARWTREPDRIPRMLTLTGARSLGLKDRLTVEAFVPGALRDRPDADGCR